MNLPFFRQWGGMEDEAVTLLGAREILEGHLPYRDFYTHISPGSYFITSIFLWVFQDPQLVSRGLACLCGGLLGAGLFLLLRVSMGLPTRWCVWAWLLCACTGVTQWPILNYHWFSTIAGLFAAACLVDWANHGRRASCWLAGAFCGLAGWTLQSDGAAVGLGGLAVALLFPPRRREFPQFLLSVLLTSAVLWTPLVVKVGAETVWRCNWNSMRHHGPFNASPFSLKWVIEPTQALLQSMGQATWNFDVAAWALHGLSYLFVWWFKYGLFWLWLLVWLVVTRPWNRPASRALLAALCGFVLLSFYRQDMLYLNYICPVLYAALADLLAWGGGGGGGGGLVRLAGAGLVATGFLLQYAGLLVDVKHSRIPIATPGGLYYTDNPAIARDIAEVGNWWRETRPDRGTVLAYPYRPAYYSLFKLKPATRFFIILPLSYSREFLELTLQDLDRSKPEWILRTEPSELMFKDYPEVDPEQFRAESRYFDERILKGYVLFRDASTQIYHRSPPSPTP